MGGQPTSPSGVNATEQDADRQFVTLIRTIHNEIDTLARMRPEFSAFAKRAKQALTDGMVKAMSGGGSGGAGQERQPMPQ